MTTLVLLKGHAGVGKTTLAQKLHRALGWDYVARDEIKEELLKQGCAESELGPKSYSHLWATLEARLAAAKSVISDTNLNQPIALEHIERIVARTHTSVVVLACFCSERIHKQRLESRKAQGLADFWIDSWEKYQTYLRSEDNQSDFTIPHPTIAVDTGGPVNIQRLAKEIMST
jgi:predicted kinase